jgi:hypothetical protein
MDEVIDVSNRLIAIELKRLREDWRKFARMKAAFSFWELAEVQATAVMQSMTFVKFVELNAMLPQTMYRS